MQLGDLLGRNRLPLIMVLIAGLFVTGCSLSPTGGSDSVSTFEGAPTVRLFSPLPNQTFLEGTTVNIQARVENAGADIALVTIFLDDAVVGQVENPNASGAEAFSVTQDWLTSVQGQYEIAVVAERADGTASERETVSVTVIKQAGVSAGDASPTPAATDDTDTADSQTADTSSSGQSAPTQNAPASTSTPAVTNTPAPPTNTPQPTATNTPSIPMAKVVSGANLRSGPSTVFEPPVGSIAANQEAEIVARNPAGDWYKIRYFNSTAWIFSSLVTTTGDVGSLPVDAGPPTPIPATNTPTPVPVTNTPTPVPSNINLIITNVAIDPHPLTCQKTAKITVSIQNNGSEGTSAGGRVFIEAILVSTGATLESTYVTFDAVPAGGSVTTGTAFITVGTNFDELQRIRATVDVDGTITESNESDNVAEGGTDYVLRKGDCG